MFGKIFKAAAIGLAAAAIAFSAPQGAKAETFDASALEGTIPVSELITQISTPAPAGKVDLEVEGVTAADGSYSKEKIEVSVGKGEYTLTNSYERESGNDATLKTEVKWERPKGATTYSVKVGQEWLGHSAPKIEAEVKHRLGDNFEVTGGVEYAFESSPRFKIGAKYKLLNF